MCTHSIDDLLPHAPLHCAATGEMVKGSYIIYYETANPFKLCPNTFEYAWSIGTCLTALVHAQVQCAGVTVSFPQDICVSLAGCLRVCKWMLPFVFCRGFLWILWNIVIARHCLHCSYANE